MRSEHLAPVVPTAFEILALKPAPINTTKFWPENWLSPKIRGGRNIFIIYLFILNSGD